MRQKYPKEKFKVVEVEVYEQDPSLAKGYDPEARVVIPVAAEVLQEEESTQTRNKSAKKAKEENKTPHAWAFFLFCLFAGISTTTLIEHPAGVLLGLGTGYLFFVEPIYNKVMSMLDRL